MSVHNSHASLFQTPVVALHACSTPGDRWKALAAELAGRFPVTVVSLPTIHEDTDASGLSALADPVIGRIAACGRPVHLVGHSMSGAVALVIALRRPDLIASLTLYEPAVLQVLDAADPQLSRQLAQADDCMRRLAETIDSGCDNDGLRAFTDFWNGPDSWNALDERDRRDLISAAPSMLRDYTRCRGEHWSCGDLASLPMPALIMMGMESADICQSASTKIAQLLPGGRLAMLPGVGHMAPASAAEWVTPRIAQHLVSVERPQTACFWPRKAAA